MKRKKFNFALIFITLLLVIFLFTGFHLIYLIGGKKSLIKGLIGAIISLFITTMFIRSCLKD